MALQCLAIVGKTNEPLYLMDVKSTDESSSDQPAEDDAFGFAEANRSEQLSLRKEFMMHASIDNLEEAMHNGRGRSSDTKWIGLLCPMEDSYIYGYVTSTEIKILAMVSDTAEPNREVHLKTLFAKVHNLFVEYMLNPWAALQSKIESKRFDAKVRECIETYNDNMNTSSSSA